MVSSNKLVPGETYSFVGTATEGSHGSLLSSGRRLYIAKFVESVGGNLKFTFNGMNLVTQPSESMEFEYQGYNPAYKGGRSRKNRKNRKDRKTRKNRKNRKDRKTRRN